jgi:hypothetical protein
LQTLISSEKYNGRFSVAEPAKNPGIPGDKGLLVPEKARHYAAVAKFPTVLDPTGKDLVIQYVPLRCSLLEYDDD